jgi:hypothetical protein
MENQMDKSLILAAVAAGTLSVEDAGTLLGKGEYKVPDISGLKVSKSGGVSIYGLQRFPITLYANQWEKIFEIQDQIKQFIIDHQAEMKAKPEKISTKTT